MSNQRTPLFAEHGKLQARIVEFAGWDMPVQYQGGIIAEHRATREQAGIFDTCHMGEFLFEGENLRDGLNCALAGDFRKLKPGRERYTFIINAQGGVVDDAVVMLFSDTKAWMVVNAGDIDGDFAAVTAALPSSVRARNISATTGKLDVQGPRAWEVIRAVLDIDFRAMPFYSFIETTWREHPLVLSRSGYTGEPGAELYIDNRQVACLWNELLTRGREFGLTPCGLGARDTLRLEAGMPLYGHELTPATNPILAGLGKFVKLDKPQDFPGKEVLRRAAAALEAGNAGLQVLVGLKLASRRTARAGFTVLRAGEPVGRVTSGAVAPTLGASIALAYVDQTCSSPGTVLAVDIRGRNQECEVVELPFYLNPALREKVTA